MVRKAAVALSLLAFVAPSAAFAARPHHATKHPVTAVKHVKKHKKHHHKKKKK